ncbi:response regulator [Sphaerochaeta sp. S2]|uniref:response regulator n=1 Tax=Sphaerochaeta sp. S2 TaxID=2798868 RepID=UPI0018E9E65B|nr:response regulator [Sphaerochaeta sp. S2]
MRGLSVVVIDDEAWTRDTIKRIGKWKEFGFRIVGEASDGHSGLECIKELSPDLIITDMKMPGLDGARMLRVLDEQKSKAKVLIISGYTDFTYTKQAVASRAIDYLLKPINADEFNTALKRCSLELRTEQRTRGPQRETTIMQVVDRNWFEQYKSVRDSVGYSLETLSSKGIEHALSQLEQLYLHCEASVRLAVLIRMNHDLQSIIEEYLISSGSQMAPHLLSFAVGEQCTFSDLRKHYLEVISHLIEEKVSENQSLHHFDIRPVKQYLDDHYQENLSLEQIATMFSVSKEYLSSRFKKDLTVTFSEYLLGLRMERAKELITEYHIPLSKIPEIVGYIDISHFYKVFKKFYGITPGAMRESSER